MKQRGWTTAELAALHAELMDIAATTSQLIASGSPISIPGQPAPVARSHPANLGRLGHAASTALLFWRASASGSRFQVWASITGSFRALSENRANLYLPIGITASLFGGLTAVKPFGAPVARSLQIPLCLLFTTLALAWLWDAWARHRIVRSPLLWLPKTRTDLLRILKISIRLALTLPLAIGALVLSTSIPSIGLFVLIPWALIVALGSLSLFPTISLLMADGRSASASLHLLANDPLRYAAGAMPTLPPCLLALFPTIALIFDNANAPAYNLAAALSLAAFLTAAAAHADYLASVYAHAAGLRP